MPTTTDRRRRASDLAVCRTVPGLTSPVACARLYDLAAAVPADQAIVEIGVYLGRSACYLGAGATAGHGADVWAVDPWDLPGERYPYVWKQERPYRHKFTHTETRDAAEGAVARLARLGLTRNVHLLRAFSVDAAAGWDHGPVGLLYIDGDHRRDAVTADWQAWKPHLAPGATVVFDDYAPRFDELVEVVDGLAAAGELAWVEQVRRFAILRAP